MRSGDRGCAHAARSRARSGRRRPRKGAARRAAFAGAGSRARYSIGILLIELGQGIASLRARDDGRELALRHLLRAGPGRTRPEDLGDVDADGERIEMDPRRTLRARLGRLEVDVAVPELDLDLRARIVELEPAPLGEETIGVTLLARVVDHDAGEAAARQPLLDEDQLIADAAEFPGLEDRAPRRHGLEERDELSPRGVLERDRRARRAAPWRRAPRTRFGSR